MLKELEHGKEWDYESYPALVAMIAPLGAVYVLVKKEPAKYRLNRTPVVLAPKYFWVNVEDSHISPRCFTWKEAVDTMREVGAVIYMYSTMDDVAHVCHWAEVQHV